MSDVLDPEERYPIAEVLGGIGIHPLPSGLSPAEAFVLVKCTDEDGDTSWV